MKQLVDCGRLRLAKLAIVGGLLTGSFGAAHAAWVGASPSPGLVEYVRTYPINVSVGLRAQVGISGFTNTCGNGDNSIYFDSDKISIDAVKAILATALAAQAQGKKVSLTYDCSLAGGGWAWGTALTVHTQ